MKPKSRKRIKSTYQRRGPFREPRKAILIVCEGTKTEPLYFEYLKRKLRLQPLEMTIEGRGVRTLNLVERAIAVKTKRKESSDTFIDEYDDVFCVSDVEVPREDNTISDAIILAEANKIKVILTNPCFEYWYILHYKKTHRGFDNNGQVIKQFKKHLPDYEKCNTKICEAVYQDTDKAIKHAEELEESVPWSDDLRKHNSSTHVHRLVKLILEISRM